MNLLFWALLAGCRRDLSDCDDRPCMVAYMKAAGDQAAVERLVDEVAALQDPVRQGLAVDVLMETWPGKTQALCQRLSVESLRERCNLTNQRPHLWQVDDADPDAGAMGAGKAYSVLRTDTARVVSPWTRVDSRQARCDDDRGQGSCQVREALHSAALGRPEEVAAFCNQISEEKWRYECYFQSAEAAFAPPRAGALPQGEWVGSPGRAAELCLGSGWFLDRCLGHLAGELANTAPAATWVAPGHWRILNRASEEVYHLLEPHGLSMATRWRSLLWTDVMEVAYGRVETLVGNPLDHVELAAGPALRASVAARLWSLEGRRGSRTLQGWSDRLREVLAARTDDPGVQPLTLEDVKVRDTWTEDLEGEDYVPWTPYLGHRARRAMSPDPQVDGVLCLLEALARAPGLNREDLVIQALEWPDPLVRWTAARLAPQLQVPVDPRFLATETDPLVWGRLLRARP